jgi:hypothetical protein
MFWRRGNPVGTPGNPVGTPGSGIRWLRPLPLLLVGSWFAHGAPLRLPPAEDSHDTLTKHLATGHGIEASPSDVVLVDPPPTRRNPFRRGRALFLGARPGEPDDVYLATLRLAPEGQLLELCGVYNLTQTTAADERRLAVDDELAAFAIGDDERDFSVHLLDLRHAPTMPANLDHLARWQLHLTWLEETGQWSGVSRRNFKLDPPAVRLRLVVDGGEVSVTSQDANARIPRKGAVTLGGRHLDERPWHVARPGNFVTWAVDRARALPWFGDERMQLLKALAYRALDRLRLSFGDWVPASETDDSMSLGTGLEPARPPVPHAEAQDPGSAWPPPDVTPILDPPLEGEGRWLTVAKDPFVTPLPDGSSPFVTTFVRTDREREYSRIMLVAWDSRLIELSAQGGVEEPKSATGETGTGLIPRDPELLPRVVAAFNGGFQSTHGEFGIQVDRVLLVPPAPFAATVAKLADGSTGFGNWPREGAVPSELVDFRQNLTALVQDGKLNPYGRSFWGGAPEGWEDRTQTVRSGLCLTPLGHLVYFYGASVDHEALGRAMLLAGCSYGMHLDMNQGHTGLEFYRVADATLLPTLGLPLEAMWQAEGEVEDAPGFRFRGRRLFKTMQLMNFPRYIRREARDFFYLTQRRLLPGKPLVAGPDAAWSQRGLDGDVFPFAVSRATFRPDPITRPETKVHALELDPARLAVSVGGTPEQRVALVPRGSGRAHVVLDEGGFAIREGTPGPEAIVLGSGSITPFHGALAAFGIRQGFLVYVEVGTAKDPAEDGEMLVQLLRRAGCQTWLILSEPPGWSLAGNVDLSGHPTELEPGAVFLAETSTPRARRIFTETPVVEQSIWRPLQRRR